jgi:hypothetical protein
MASGNGVPGKRATKAQEWLQNYHPRKWWKLQELHESWTLDSTLRDDIANHQEAMENQGYDPRQPDWARIQ